MMSRRDIFKIDNISTMFVTTAAAMIMTEITSVLAVMIDGIIASRYLGVNTYSGISLLRPFSCIVLVIAGFFSTGCNLTCSKKVAIGDKDSANEAFNLTVFLAIVAAAILIVSGYFFPEAIFRISGIPLHKHPGLSPFLYGYLRGYLLGIPALLLVQIIGPVLVMDNGKTLFTVSSIVLFTVDILGDMLNVFYFHAGAFGMGIATSAGYYAQLIALCYYLIKKDSYFRISLKALAFRQLPDLAVQGSPALIQRLAGTLRDAVTNYYNVILALTTAAIAAKGIQGDLFQFLFCLPNGLGRTLMAMVSIYYSANDRKGLERLYTFALRFGLQLAFAAGAVTFLAAPLLTRLYSTEPEVVSLTVYSIRWMSVGLIFDMAVVLIQNYFQGINNHKLASALSFSERFIVPTGTALILGKLYGSKGILVSIAVSKIIVFAGIFICNCIYHRGLPRFWKDVMFLSKDFGGDDADNMYSKIRDRDDVMRVSRDTEDFCMQHEAGIKISRLMALFVEEMTVNVLDHAEKVNKKGIYIDFRLFSDTRNICFTIMDLSDRFDPTLFYKLNRNDMEEHYGIRMVMELAEEVHYYSAFNSNNLIVYLKYDSAA